MSRFRLNTNDIITLGFILIIAGVLRLGEAGMVEFFHDEAMLSLLAQDMTRGGVFPLVGILSSVGIPNPPTSVYVMAIPYALTDNPLTATMFVAALNVIGVGAAWWLARRYFSPTVALVAALVYAVNPWAVLYSRKIWAQDFHTPFILLAFGLGLIGFREGKRWAQVACLPVLLFALQIHFAAWALLPVYLVLVWMGGQQNNSERRTPRAMSLPVFILTAVLSFMTLAPYLVGLAQTLQQDPTRISDALNRTDARASGLSLSADALRFTLYQMTGLGVETWAAPNQQADLLASVPPIVPLWMLIGVAAVIGMMRVWRGQVYRPSAWWLTTWALLPLVVFTPTWTTVYPHYLIGAIPVWALLTGIGVEALIHGGQRFGQTRIAQALSLQISPKLFRAIMLVAVSVILLTQAFWWRGLMRYLDSHEISFGAGTSGYTTPLHYLLPVRDAVRGYDDVVVLSDGMDILFDVEPARWAALLRDTTRCIRTLPAEGFLVYPAGRFAVIQAPNSPQTISAYFNAESLTFQTRQNGGVYRVQTFEQPLTPTLTLQPLAAPFTFANGVQLTAQLVTEGRLWLEWRLPDAPNDANVQYFVHLLDANGGRLEQYDQSFWLGRHWCSGDRLWSSVIRANPTSMPIATLRVGFYALGTGTHRGAYFPVDVLDAMGNPAGNWVDIAMSGEW